MMEKMPKDATAPIPRHDDISTIKELYHVCSSQNQPSQPYCAPNRLLSSHCGVVTVLFTTCVAWLSHRRLFQIFSSPPYSFGIEQVGALTSLLCGVGLGATLLSLSAMDAITWKENRGIYVRASSSTTS